MSSIYVTNSQLQALQADILQSVARIVREELAGLRNELTTNAADEAREAGRQVGRVVRNLETRLDALSAALSSGLQANALKAEGDLTTAAELVSHRLRVVDAVVANAGRQPQEIWIRHQDGTRTRVVAGPVTNTGEQEFSLEHDDGTTATMSTGPTMVPTREVG